MIDQKDIDDCAHHLAVLALKEDRAVAPTIDDCLIRNGVGAAAALRKAFEALDPPGTSVTAAIRSELDHHAL